MLGLHEVLTHQQGSASWMKATCRHYRRFKESKDNRDRESYMKVQCCRQNNEDKRAMATQWDYSEHSNYGMFLDRAKLS